MRKEQVWLSMVVCVLSLALAGVVFITSAQALPLNITSDGHLGDISPILNDGYSCLAQCFINTDNGNLYSGTFAGPSSLIRSLNPRVVSQPNGPDVAVFDFTTFTIRSRVNIYGSRPAVIATVGDLTIDGYLDASGYAAVGYYAHSFFGNIPAPAPGGGLGGLGGDNAPGDNGFAGGGFGNSGGAGGQGPGSLTVASWYCCLMYYLAGGGGGGGNASAGEPGNDGNTMQDNSGVVHHLVGGAGGQPQPGNLLLGGGGGAGGGFGFAYGTAYNGSRGGNGGGGILFAVGGNMRVTTTGVIDATGMRAGPYDPTAGGGGGGAGGDLWFDVAGSWENDGLVTARGGAKSDDTAQSPGGGPPFGSAYSQVAFYDAGAGGDGSGGQLLIQARSIVNNGLIDVSGAAGGLITAIGSPVTGSGQAVGMVDNHITVLAGFTIRPNNGGDTGHVTVGISGSGFQHGATVKLARAGQPDIVGDPVTVYAGGLKIATTFNLVDKARGLWDAVVTNPDGTSTTLPGGFTIEEGRDPQVWVDIVGRNTILYGRPYTYYIVYGNRGNVDAVGVPLWIAAPKDAAIKLGFNVAPPPEIEGLPPIDWDQVPVQVKTEGDVRIPVILPVVPAGFSGMLSFDLTMPFPSAGAVPPCAAGLKAWVDRRMFLKPQVDPQRALCDMTLVKDAITLATNFIPGVDCAKAAYSFYANQYYGTFTSAFQTTFLAGGGPYVPSAVRTTTDLVRFTALCLQDVMPGGMLIADALKAATWVYNALDTYGACIDLLYQSAQHRNLICASSFDPNDKTGSQGAGELQYISGEEPLRYAIYFENEATATAPAQEVVITDQLDLTKMDVSTFSLGPLIFGNKLITPPPGLNQYTTDVDLRPTRNLIVRINAGLNANTGLHTWRFTSIDPATGQLTTDPLGGFLPPNVNPPKGQGNVLFTVMPKKGLPTGTEFRNRARVVFDVNAPIDTPEWLNTLDNTKPTSQVSPLPATESAASFTVQWAGTDVGSGIQDYTVFVSDNGGSFTPFVTNTTATAATFTGQFGHTYRFYSVARDQTGNVERKTLAAEATTQVVADTIPPTTLAAASPPPNANGWNNTTVTVTLSATANPGGSGVKQIQVSLTGASSGTQTVSGSSAAVTIANEGVTTLTYFATDNAGNQEAPKTLTVQIDKTPPVITGSRSPAPNAYGWNNTNVTVSFSCADVGAVQSGIATNTVASQTLSAEGAGQSVTNTGTCTDRAGNVATLITVSNINIDKTPPNIGGLPAPSCSLWPPNHQLVQVATVTVQDGLSGVDSGSVAVTGTSNEPENGLGDGDQAPDIIITGRTVQLRAERAGSGTGRIYTLRVTAADLASNTAAATATCLVPHDQGKK